MSVRSLRSPNEKQKHMIFKQQDPRQWHRAFAWWPVPLDDDRFAWWQSIERRLLFEHVFTEHWEYRLPQ